MARQFMSGTVGLLAGLALYGGPVSDAAWAGEAASPPTLQDAYRKDFLIGAAIAPSTFQERDATKVALAVRQFDSITPENVMKWGVIHPAAGRYDFAQADQFVDFGERHHMAIIGHTLIWHSQVPSWVFADDQGKPLSRDALLARMKDHIQTVVGRYKGRIKGWDVVNEALNEDGSLRDSPWRKIIGDDYIEMAFRYAHEADPGAELYYNDYSVENYPKRHGAVALMKALLAKGIPVTAIGLQNHDRLDWPSISDEDQTISEFADLGLKVNITELDIDVLPSVSKMATADVGLSVAADPKLNPYPDGLPDSLQQLLAVRYQRLFGVFLKHRKTVLRVTFWNLTDDESWLNNWPVPGRTSYPLLFDRHALPKPAFAAVLQAAQSVDP